MKLFFIAGPSREEKRQLRMSKIIHMDYSLGEELGILVPDYHIPNVEAVAPQLIGNPVDVGFDWLWKLERAEGFEIPISVSRWPNNYVGRWMYATQMELASVLGTRPIEIRYRLPNAEYPIDEKTFYIFVNASPPDASRRRAAREYWGILTPPSDRDMHAVDKADSHQLIRSPEGDAVACLIENALYIFPDITAVTSWKSVNGVAIYRQILRQAARLLTAAGENEPPARSTAELFPEPSQLQSLDRALSVATAHVRQEVNGSQAASACSYESAALNAVNLHGVATVLRLNDRCAELLSPERGGREPNSPRLVAERLMDDPRIENVVVQPSYVQVSTTDLLMRDINCGHTYRLGEIALRYSLRRWDHSTQRNRVSYSIRAWNLSELVRFDRALYSHPYVLQDREHDIRGPYGGNVRNILNELAKRGMFEAALNVKLSFLQTVDSSFPNNGAPFRCWRRLN